MRVHFIAMGGSIMHSLAIALHKKGYIVTGSDDYIYEPSRSHLAQHNLLPKQVGWDPSHITSDLDAVLLGMHAKQDNPELIRAQELNIPIFSYPEFIYEQSKEKLRVVIAGSHGKTTITSMIMHVLRNIGKNFDYVVGAKMDEFDELVHLSKDAPFILIEGDEYLSSSIDRRSKFHHYHPHIALITGIAWDHVHVFPTFESYVKQFKLFMDQILPKGTLIYNKEDPHLIELVRQAAGQIHKHGYKTPAYTINKGITSIETPLGWIPLQVFGKHNISNIAAAYTVCEWLGVSRQDFYTAIQDFKGASRRLEFIASNGDEVVYQDFAHTPAKVRASIHALIEQYPEKELIAITELKSSSHLDLSYLQQFKDAMQEAKIAAVFINHEQLKQKNVTSGNSINENILRAAFNRPDLIIFVSQEQIMDFLNETSSKGKNLLFMSTGHKGSINLVIFAEKFFSE
jgi:UDP-N-acetylmuramate: L-alanyl-gamma-D-glutamyl-meso-diaminopimelate ligase